MLMTDSTAGVKKNGTIESISVGGYLHSIGFVLNYGLI